MPYKNQRPEVSTGDGSRSTAIKQTLETNGQYRPIVVNRGGNTVLADNHTLEAAKELGWEMIAVTFVGVDDEWAKRIVVVDNRTNELAGYDSEALAEPRS